MFEAFSNSLEATSGKDNHITVIVNRLKMGNVIGEDTYQFGSLSIVDDGEGFTEESFRRFEQLFDDSKQKNNLGSGRVQFLHFFQHTLIDSVYKDGVGATKRRAIDLSGNFYERHRSVICSTNTDAEGAPQTTVSFFYSLLKDDEKNKLDALTAEEIKDAILKRYLNTFCINRDNLQVITIKEYVNGVPDETKTQTISPSDIPTADYEDTVTIHYSCLAEKGKEILPCSQTEDFKISTYYLPSSILRKNEVRLTSKGESFSGEGFDFSLISEAPHIIEGKSLLVLVASDYLTSKDTDVRGKLDLYSKKDFIEKRHLFTGKREILIDDIEDSTVNRIVSHYPKIKTAQEEANNNLQELAAMFSIDLEVIESAGVKCSDSDINVFKKVYTYRAEQKATGDAKIKHIIESLKELDPTDKSFQTKFKNKVDELNTTLPLSVKVELSNYLTRRTLVIEMMEKALQHQLAVQNTSPTGKKGKKKKDKEGIFHNLIFPQRTDNVIESNLWMLNDEYIHFKGMSESKLDDVLIDGEPLFKTDLTEEELSYKNRQTGNVGDRRPDILLFPSEGKCIIIEFKAPDVDVAKHLHQIDRYASIIANLSNEKFKFKTFYGYLIGENVDIYQIMDSDGDFLWSQNLGYIVRPYKAVPDHFNRGKAALYTEIITFSDLVKRAKLRNTIFSDKILPKESDK